MSSQAQRNQAKWQSYCRELRKIGYNPRPELIQAHAVVSQYWNTVDNNSISELNKILEE